MGHTVYWMNVSLDLRIEARVGENGAGDWMRIGEELHRDFNARARDLDLLFQGRKVYEIMESFWPAAANDDSLPDYIREFGSIWTEIPKVLVSDSRSEAPHNTRVIGGPDTVERLATIRADTDGAIGVGGATLATTLLCHRLLDELLLYVHPAVLGSGRSLFDEPTEPLALEPIGSATFPEGVEMRRCRIEYDGP